MCSNSDPSPFPCVCFASIRSITTAFSGENGTTVCRGGDRHRKRFDRTSCETSACYSSAITTVSATRRRRFRLLGRSFLTLLTGFVAQIQQCNALPLRGNSRGTDFLSTKFRLSFLSFGEVRTCDQTGGGGNRTPEKRFCRPGPYQLATPPFFGERTK